jgi:hypothetical protein
LKPKNLRFFASKSSVIQKYVPTMKEENEVQIKIKKLTPMAV